MPPPQAGVAFARPAVVALVTLAAFIDLVTYSVAVPVLPDLSRRFGASPTMVGLLFSSFGATLLLVSIPMGAIADRVSRRLLLVAGLVALAASNVLFALAGRMAWLFAARLVQGAADAVTWIVGFALIADLYAPTERGRVMGFVMSGTSFGLMIGPTVGGWLYEAGGLELPFLAVAAAALVVAGLLAVVPFPSVQASSERVPVFTIMREPAVATCAVVVIVGAATMAMLEPVLSLWFASDLGLGPARIGLVFGAAAVASTVLHPVYGGLADRVGARRLTLLGLVLMASFLPVLTRASSFESAVVLFVIQAAAIALVVTPSLAYMADVVSSLGAGSYGVAYGLYNFAWGVGLLAGPALGGFLFERLGFSVLALVWAPVVLGLTAWLARAR
jgi:multidrug resistance protein